jgi:sugar/nucleoside kinase (ribokinase family)
VLADKEYRIQPVKCENILDSTGCGDTYMAAYISKKLTTESILKSANFASKIASDKLSFFGPFKSDI